MTGRLGGTILCVLVGAAVAGPGRVQAQVTAGYALRFFGQGVSAPDVDRVKIRIDSPATPADVGATDFTIEFWVRGTRSANPAGTIGCGATYSWITGNTVIDRDRYNQTPGFGISFGAGRVAFGVKTAAGSRTICGTTDVLDGAWHHVAVLRQRSSGLLGLFVDGALQASATGPTGDLSYPDGAQPGNYCGGPCTNSDPFLVLGAEKHDAGSAYPSFNGWLDELRVSTVLRYSDSFARPTQPFVPDAATAALYHFDEGQGSTVNDVSGAPGGPSDGVVRVGGALQGPQWVVSDAPIDGTSPPLPPTPPPTPPPAGTPLNIALNMATFRAGQTMSMTLRASAGHVAGPVDVYAVIQMPGSQWLSLQLSGALVPGIVPIARSVSLPDANVNFAFVIPAGTPIGDYAWLTAAAAPGTLALITPLASTPFSIVP